MSANQYNDSEALTNYVFSNYRRLMTHMEARASHHLMMTAMERAHGPNPQGTALNLRLNQTLLPEAAHLLADGSTLFRERLRDRILSDHADKIVLNRCEKCGCLCRTPKACLCPECNHTWYERRNQGAC
jgi:hypothetical protein